MSKRNYNKMSNPQVKKDPEEIQNGVAPVEVVDEPKVEKPIIGVVANCERLNVREKPTVMADVLYLIYKGSEVVINKEGSTKDFYKVELSSGVEGFCMKKYIVLQQ